MNSFEGKLYHMRVREITPRKVRCAHDYPTYFARFASKGWVMPIPLNLTVPFS